MRGGRKIKKATQENFLNIAFCQLPSIPESYRSHPGAQYLQRVAKTVYGERAWGMISARLGNSGA